MRDVKPGDVGRIVSDYPEYPEWAGTTLTTRCLTKNSQGNGASEVGGRIVSYMSWTDTCLVIARVPFNENAGKDDVLVVLKGTYGWMKSMELVRA